MLSSNVLLRSRCLGQQAGCGLHMGACALCLWQQPARETRDACKIARGHSFFTDIAARLPQPRTSGANSVYTYLKVVLESCERGRFSQSRMLAAARRGASASPHGPGMHPHTLLFRMPMRSVDAVVVLQLCSAATAPVSRVAAFGRAAPASSAARRRGGTRALRIPSEGRRLERWSRASRQTRRRHPYPRPHP